MIQSLQTKPVIWRITGQEQMPAVNESRGPSSFFVSMSTFKGSQALSAHNLFLFFYCFDVISCFPRQELVHSGWERDKNGCATFWHWSKITLFPPSRHTLNKWEIREAKRHFHMGLKRQKGQLVHSSLLCCVLGFYKPQGQIASALVLMCIEQ